jgi:hypothetical protein
MQSHRIARLSEVCMGMDSMVLWPLLSIAAVTIAWVPTIQDSGYRSLTYWLIVPPLLAGVLAAWAHFGSS